MTATASPYEEHLDYIRESPRESGELKLIVVRPKENERTVLESCLLSLAGGAEGDNWAEGCWKSLDDGSPHPDVQLAIMNTRVLESIEPSSDRWPLAGDTLYTDYCLDTEHLQPGDRLAIGDCIVEITEVPHLGCGKFKDRYGKDALRFVNSPVGKELRARGVYARVVQDAVVNTGDRITKVAS